MMCIPTGIAAVAGSDLYRADHHRLDALERRMLVSGVLMDQPLTHLWLPGLYVRTVTNPAGCLVTTETHRTRHPFFVMRGIATVSGPDGVRAITAPHQGVTEPGTRRLIFAGHIDASGQLLSIGDVVWTTVHAITPEEEAEPDEETRIGMVRARITERRELEPGKSAHEIFRELMKKELTA